MKLAFTTFNAAFLNTQSKNPMARCIIGQISDNDIFCPEYIRLDSKLIWQTIFYKRFYSLTWYLWRKQARPGGTYMILGWMGFEGNWLLLM